ncbi:membrane protein [Bacillus sp. 31A1R]|uniref:Membrane protein n=1 Tax=Robertmurraya mangrovi TaxID=3098077 RepID=A0ABU5J2A3_9BACI|nr:membrane protein [Bacillus sp. 31A1R]MDZ5473539.1 membrane protein [Bacillus sp. 31A1R]
MYRTLFFIIGLIILTFGVSLTIKADLGAGAWDALNVGLSTEIGLTIGSWVIIVGLFLMLMNAYLLRTKPEYLALLTIMIVGALIDFWMLVILKNFHLETLLLQIIVLVVGMVTVGLGAAIYLQPKYPLIPIDQFMLALKYRLKVNLMIAKTVAEIIALILALLVKGPIGIGTLIITFCMGPCIQVFYPYFEKWLNKLIKEA